MKRGRYRARSSSIYSQHTPKMRDQEENPFEGDEYQLNSFRTQTDTSSIQNSKRSKRYGLSSDDQHHSEEEEEEEEDSDLEVIREEITPKVREKYATGRMRFETLSMEELGWMGVSALLVLGLSTGAIVVAIVG